MDCDIVIVEEDCGTRVRIWQYFDNLFTLFEIGK